MKKYLKRIKGKKIAKGIVAGTVATGALLGGAYGINKIANSRTLENATDSASKVTKNINQKLENAKKVVDYSSKNGKKHPFSNILKNFIKSKRNKNSQDNLEETFELSDIENLFNDVIIEACNYYQQDISIEEYKMLYESFFDTIV